MISAISMCNVGGRGGPVKRGSTGAAYIAASGLGVGDTATVADDDAEVNELKRCCCPRAAAGNATPTTVSIPPYCGETSGWLSRGARRVGTGLGRVHSAEARASEVGAWCAPGVGLGLGGRWARCKEATEAENEANGSPFCSNGYRKMRELEGRKEVLA